MDLEEQVEKLTKETMAFRKEMLIMKGLLKQQNNLLRDLIEINHKTLNAKQYNKVCTIGNVDITFPLATVEDLDYLENSMEDTTNRNMIIDQIERIVGDKTLSKKLDQVLCMDLILKFNVDGHQNKRRLLDYPHFMDVLFKATMKADGTNDSFRDELRQSIRRCKNRHFKTTCLQRKKQKLLNDDE